MGRAQGPWFQVQYHFYYTTRSVISQGLWLLGNFQIPFLNQVLLFAVIIPTCPLSSAMICRNWSFGRSSFPPGSTQPHLQSRTAVTLTICVSLGFWLQGGMTEIWYVVSGQRHSWGPLAWNGTTAGGEIYLPGHHHLGELPGDMSDSVIRFATIKCALVKKERTDVLHLSESGNYSWNG